MFHCISHAMNDIAILLHFSITPQSIEYFKSGNVYVRQHREKVPMPLHDVDPPPEPVPVEPRHSVRTFRAPDRYSPDRYDSSYFSDFLSL